MDLPRGHTHSFTASGDSSAAPVPTQLPETIHTEFFELRVSPVSSTRSPSKYPGFPCARPSTWLAKPKRLQHWAFRLKYTSFETRKSPVRSRSGPPHGSQPTSNLTSRNVRVNQCSKPTGWLGRFTLWRMNSSHSKLTDWGLGHITIENRDTILDVGCEAVEPSIRWQRSRHKERSTASIIPRKASRQPRGPMHGG